MQHRKNKLRQTATIQQWHIADESFLHRFKLLKHKQERAEYQTASFGDRSLGAVRTQTDALVESHQIDELSVCNFDVLRPKK